MKLATVWVGLVTIVFAAGATGFAERADNSGVIAAGKAVLYKEQIHKSAHVTIGLTSEDASVGELKIFVFDRDPTKLTEQEYADALLGSDTLDLMEIVMAAIVHLEADTDTTAWVLVVNKTKRDLHYKTHVAYHDN